MGIISRFGDIMAADIGAAFNREPKDPNQMIDEYLRQLTEDLGKVRAETASVMGEERRAKQLLDSCDQNIARYEQFAAKALAAGREQDAETFLREKMRIEATRPTLEMNYQVAAENSAKMRQMYNKISQDIEECKSRRDIISGKVRTAQAMQRINYLEDTTSDSSLSSIRSLEAKTDRLLAEYEAQNKMREQDAKVAALKKKYDLPSQSSLDDELRALKIKMGQELPEEEPEEEITEEITAETPEEITEETTEETASAENEAEEEVPEEVPAEEPAEAPESDAVDLDAELALLKENHPEFSDDDTQEQE